VSPLAPIPIVGISSILVIAAATLVGMHSSTTAKAPASCKRIASSRSARARTAVRPWARKKYSLRGIEEAVGIDETGCGRR
jgi:hypothetical protein